MTPEELSAIIDRWED